MKYIFSTLGYKNIIKSFRHKFLAFVIVFGVMTIFASCGGDGGSDNNDTSGTTYDVSGYIQKGPFISGSSVTIYELDANLNQTGVSFQTQTVDDFGSFILPKKVTSEYIEIISNGYYFNEVEGQLSSSTIALSSISDSTVGDIDVNILTCLASKRIRHLVQTDKKSFKDARSQAEREVLDIFNFEETEISNFDQMNISKEGDSNAMLLAVSVILQGNNTVAELSELISKIGLDIEKDGTLDNPACVDEIADSKMTLDCKTIRFNLESRYASLGTYLTISNFEDYVYGNNPFSLGQTFNTGDYPQSLALGDLDGDGDLDLAVANEFSNNVSVHLNSGDGTFAAGVTYSITEGPHYVMTGDLDGDDNLDIIVVSWLHPIVSVLSNNGNGTFSAAMEYNINGNYSIPGSGLISATAGDFNGDGDLDLAVTRCSYPDNAIIVLLNNGDGTFPTQVTYNAGCYPHHIAAGDLDGDGHIDLAVAESDFWLGPSSSSVSVFLNNGDGTFADEVDYSTGEYPDSIVLGDFDGDGDLDIAVADANSENDFFDVSVLLNNGDGAFTTNQTYNSGGHNYYMIGGDLDEDSDLDLAVVNQGGISVLLNNGDGDFASAWDYNAGFNTAILMTEGDLDGDGDLDLAIADADSGTVSVIRNNTNN
jgi:hypothetical protein